MFFPEKVQKLNCRFSAMTTEQGLGLYSMYFNGCGWDFAHEKAAAANAGRLDRVMQELYPAASLFMLEAPVRTLKD